MDRPEAARRGRDRRLCDDLARGLGAEPTVRLAWLFGSRARGAARRDSDVDVAGLVGDACTAGPGAAKDTMFRGLARSAGSSAATASTSCSSTTRLRC